MMDPVEIHQIQESLVLRSKQTELWILPVFMTQLKILTVPKDFSQYFLREALVNRSARKLFESWARKDSSLWPRIYKAVHPEKNS